MTIAVLIGLTRARVALLIAGLAWVVGLTPPLGARIAVAALTVAAIAIDGLIDDQRIRERAKAPATDYQAAA